MSIRFLTSVLAPNLSRNPCMCCPMWFILSVKPSCKEERKRERNFERERESVRGAKRATWLVIYESDLGIPRSCS